MSVKSYAFENGACQAVNESYEQLQEAIYKRAMVSLGAGTVSSVVSGCASVALLWWGAKLSIDRQISIGQLMFFDSVLGLFLGAVDRLAVGLAAIQDGVALERVRDISQSPPEHEGCFFGFGKSRDCDTIELKNASFMYWQGSSAVNNVSLRLTNP